MRHYLFFSFFLSISIAYGQNLYTKAFGKPENKPLLFLHDGPGNNCARFEITTAQRLANQGFYVIVYDRRGEGRSTDPNAEYSFAEASTDIQMVMQHYKLQKVSLIGHRFGGMLAVKFAQIHPELVNTVVIISTPILYHDSFSHTIARCKSIYETKNDLSNLKYIGLLQEVDSTSPLYASYCMHHAHRNGLHTTKNPTKEAKAIYTSIKANPVLKRWNDHVTQEAAIGFANNENYTTIDLSNTIKQLIEKKCTVYGLYGQDDGFISTKQILNLKKILDDQKVYFWSQCSQNVFIDQQSLFIETLKKLL